MSRTRTENEYIGKLLELPVFCALSYLKQNGLIKDYTPNYPKKYGGDWDAIVLLNDGSFLDIECMNFNTKYDYSEKSSRIGGLSNRLKEAKQFFGKVRKIVLVITNCLTANSSWLNKKCIEPIFIGEQISGPLSGKKKDDFVNHLAGMLTALIDRIEKKSMKLSHLDYLFWIIKSSLVNVIRSFQEIALPSDDIKWICAVKKNQDKARRRQSTLYIM